MVCCRGAQTQSEAASTSTVLVTQSLLQCSGRRYAVEVGTGAYTQLPNITSMQQRPALWFWFVTQPGASRAVHPCQAPRTLAQAAAAVCQPLRLNRRHQRHIRPLRCAHDVPIHHILGRCLGQAAAGVQEHFLCQAGRAVAHRVAALSAVACEASHVVG